MTSPASNGQQQPSQPQPTMADAGRNGPLAPHGTMEHFDGHTPPHSPKNYNRLLGGLSPIRTMHRCGD